MEPVYSDEIYLQKLNHFMEEYGRHFNGHPAVEYIDFGSFGTFGEGHTGFASERQYPLATLLRHVQMHLRNFPDTRVLLTTDSVGHLGAASAEDAAYFLEYCQAHGMGIRSDSLYVAYFFKTFGASMMKMPTAFDLFWKEAPVDLEWQHQKKLADGGYYDGGLRALDSISRTHATYMGFHGDPYIWYENNRFLHDEITNRLGYWYFIEGYELAENTVGKDVTWEEEGHLTQGIHTNLRLYVENRGAAPAYHAYQSRVLAVNEQGEEFDLEANSPDNRKWMPGESAKETLHLKTGKLPVGAYRLYYGLFAENRPILFGMKAERRRQDGMHLLGRLIIE